MGPLNHVEIRSYNLKPGACDAFHRIVLEQAMPMLRRWKTDVVAHGPSPHDGDSYYIIRAYGSLEQRKKDQDAFYGSAEWRDGPRDQVMALIESYATIVLEMDDQTLKGLRRDS